MSDVVGLLKEEEKALERRLYAVQRAIEALEDGVKVQGKHTMSAAARKKISLAQKARWAKVKKKG